MDSVLETLLLAFAIGFTGALAPGPTLVATIQASVRGGWTMGPKVTFGHIVIETLVFLLILFGLSTVALTYSRPVALLGGAALVAFGILTVKESVQARLDQQYSGATGNPYLAGIITGVTNPYFWIWWLTVGSALLVKALGSGILLAVTFMIGHWGADAVWLTAVATGIHRGRTILSQQGYRWTLLLCGAFLIIFGGYYLSSAATGGAI